MATYYIEIHPDEEVRLDPPPRRLAARARRKVVLELVLAMVLLGLGAVALASGKLGPILIGLLLTMTGLWFGWSGILYWRLFRGGEIRPATIRLDAPPAGDDELRFASPGDAVAGAPAVFQKGLQLGVFVEYECDGGKRSFGEGLGEGDFPAPVRFGNGLAAAVLVDPRHTRRARLLTSGRPRSASVKL